VPEFKHKSVMVDEVLEALRLPRSGGRWADLTVGGGGHAEAILSGTRPNGFLFGCDRDGAAIEAAKLRLAPYAGRFELRRANFADVADWIEPGSCAGVVLDLGVSSAQLDWPERGFSFQQEGPLDMRMDSSGGATAADLVNGLSETELSELFWRLGDEPQARRIARAIALDRQSRRIESTSQLAGLIERVAPRPGKKHPATRVFLALRMAVNDELGSLKRGLAAASTLLAKNGRMAILTFHSVEDRLVKEFGRAKSRGYVVRGDVDLPEFRTAATPELRLVTRKAIKPADAELEQNPRARSAQLRVFEKVE
jgi:16S rRNA (cytosine1402-N4)-methyltransferase